MRAETTGSARASQEVEEFTELTHNRRVVLWELQPYDGTTALDREFVSIDTSLVEGAPPEAKLPRRG